ncbi:MAG: hypothetical protein R3D67_06920 [Hyphomicrobiaceae bacterium]
MKLGLLLRYSGDPGGPNTDLVLEAERLGYESVWQGESYGIDSVADHLDAGPPHQGRHRDLDSRPHPACTAMTAMTLAAMSTVVSIWGLARLDLRWSKAGTACPTASHWHE